MRLALVELRRFWARRVTRLTFALALLVVAIVMTVQVVRSERTVREERVFLGPVPQDCIITDDGREIVDDACADAYYSGPVGTAATPTDAAYDAVQVTDDRRIDIGANYGEVLPALGAGLLFLGFVLGASFLGAEYGAASLSTQMLFEPRRWRVHLAKATGAGVGGGLVTLGVVVVLGALMYLGSLTRGIVEGLDGTWWTGRALDVARVATGSAIATAMAYTVTAVARRTVAGVGIFFVQPLLAIFIRAESSSWWPDLVQYSPLNALSAFTVNDFDSPLSFYGLHTLGGAAVLTAVWLGGLAAASGLVFSRAEIR